MDKATATRKNIELDAFGIAAWAFRLRGMLETVAVAIVREILAAERTNEPYVGRVPRQTPLEPEIVETLVNGSQGRKMTLLPFMGRWWCNLNLGYGWGSKSAVLSPCQQRIPDNGRTSVFDPRPEAAWTPDRRMTWPPVPLLPETAVPATVTRLNSRSTGSGYSLIAGSIVTVPRRQSRGAVTLLKDRHDTIPAAIDFLLPGF